MSSFSVQDQGISDLNPLASSAWFQKWDLSCLPNPFWRHLFFRSTCISKASLQLTLQRGLSNCWERAIQSAVRWKYMEVPVPWQSAMIAHTLVTTVIPWATLANYWNYDEMWSHASTDSCLRLWLVCNIPRVLYFWKRS